MKKLIIVIAGLMIGAAVLPGCRAEAEVGDDAQSNVAAPR